MEANNHINETSPKIFNNWYYRPGFSEKFNFWFGSILIEFPSGVEPGKGLDVTSENIFVICNVHYFDFLVSCMYVFNLLSLSSKWVTTLVATSYKNMESAQSYKNTSMTMVKNSEWRPFTFFMLNCVLQQKWKQNVPENISNVLVEFL